MIGYPVQCNICYVTSNVRNSVIHQTYAQRAKTPCCCVKCNSFVSYITCYITKVWLCTSMQQFDAYIIGPLLGSIIPFCFVEQAMNNYVTSYVGTFERLCNKGCILQAEGTRLYFNINTNTIYCDIQCYKELAGLRPALAPACCLLLLAGQVSPPAAHVLCQTQMVTDSECQHFPSVWVWLTESPSYLEQLVTITPPCTTRGNLKSSLLRAQVFHFQLVLKLPVSCVATQKILEYCSSNPVQTCQHHTSPS